MTDGSAPQPGAGLPSLLPNAVSAGGRYVVFKSAVANIVANDTNALDDIFVRDRVTGVTTRVSVSSSGVQANGPSDYPSISADGRYVTFGSQATNLVADDGNGNIWDVFVHDLVTRTTTLVSRTNADGPVDSNCTIAVITPGGRFVVFMSASYTLDPSVMPNANTQLFLRDRDFDGNGILDEPGNSRTTLVSVNDNGLPGNSYNWPFIDITPDGRYIAYSSWASNLVPNDTNDAMDVFVRDLQTGLISRVSVSTNGTETPANTRSSYPSLSADGRFVVFESDANNLVAGDTNGKFDVFVHDRQTGETTRVSMANSGQEGDLESQGPSISDDGRYVAFQSKALSFGGSPNRWNVYVRDRQLETTTVVNRQTNGGSFLVDATMPTISGDGTTVIFRVLNAGFQNAATSLYSAIEFSVTPTHFEVMPAGGEQIVTVTAPGENRWSASTFQPSWITVIDGANRTGGGALRFNVAQSSGSTVRSGTVTIGSKQVTLVQSPGFTLQSVSPSSGSASGGTTIYLNGSRFEAGTSVLLDGQPIAATLVNSTLLWIVTPSHVPGVVDVTVTNPDGQTRTLTGGYRFVDTTPPVVTATLNGAVYGNNGWIINTPIVTWTVTDPESAVTSSNCNPITVYNDTFPWTQYGCSATSAGGTITGWTEKLYRDTYAPTVTLNSPSAALYTPGQNVVANYTCTDGSSKVASCVGTKPSGTAVDTAAPGIYDFTLTGTDNAGWTKTVNLTYGVTSGVCTPMPSDIVSWWTGDNTLNDLIGANHGTMIGSWPYSPYDPGFVGPSSLIHTGYIGYNFGHDPSLKMTTAFTVGAWIFAKKVGYADGTLISKKGEFGLNLYLGRLGYTFASQNAKYTSFEVKYDTWTHVAMTYDAGALTIYANGRPVATETVAATLVDAVPGTDDFVVGAGQGVTWPFNTGSIDDVQLYRRALTPAELESMYLSGRSGLCAPAATALTASATPATYGSDATTTVTAQLTSNGAGLAGRTVSFSLAGTPAGTAVTDADGNASLTVSLAGKNAGTYAIVVTHGGDSSYGASTATTSVTVAKRPTTIVWATPAPITYGTSLSPAILNATLTETVSGTFVYTPNATIPPPNAGTLTLNVTFYPSSTVNYLSSTASVTLEVLPATTTITLTGGTFTYDKQTHAATASATGAGGVVPTVTYNGSSTLPRDAGEYTVVASIEATQNYSGANATATVTILKATPAITLTGGGTFTYDKQTHAATVSATGVGGDTFAPALTYNGESTPPVNAGVYSVVAALDATQNYNAANATVTITILKATPTITLTGSGTFVYDKQTHAATVSASGVGGEVLTPTLTYNGTTTVPLDAGDYAVVATLDATQNYNAASDTATITILKATPTMTVGTYQTYYTYDGQPHSGVAWARGVGGEDLTPVTLTYNGATGPPVNAGTYTLLGSYEGSQNYEAATKTSTMEIRKRWVGMSGGISNFPRYDGTPKTISSAEATGLNGEQLPVTVTYNGSSTPPIDAGSYTVTIIYEGSQNYEPNSLTLSSPFTISKAYITITLSDGPPYITYDGNSHGATATATGIFGEDLTPEVTVTYNGGSTPPLNAGTYTILASYPGTANYAPRTAGRTLTINKVSSSMSWGAPQPMIYGQALGPAQLKATASNPGTFTYSPAAGTVPHRGSVPLQATFVPSDPTNYHSGTINTTVAVSPAPLTVKANDAVKAFGAPLPAFTASFIGFVNGDTPASLGGALGFSTTATDQSAPGTYPIGVGGVASNDYTITFASGVLTVQPIATSLTVGSSANPSGANQPVTFTASVTAAGAGQPTGTVTFLDGSTVLGTAAVQNGAASLTTIPATGTHSITATYAGDTTFAASSSAALTQTVNASSTSTTTTVTSSRNPARTGQSVTLTARVQSPAGTPAGEVEFLDAGVVIGTGTLSGSGQATLTTTTLTVGSHPITVRYLGNGAMPPSLSATLVQVVNTSSSTVKSTTTTLSASPSTGSYGTQTTFTVSVAPPLFNSAPTGSVLVTIDGVSSTVVALTTSSGKGVATLSTSALARGKHLVTVTYLGSGTYAGSTATLTYTVN